MKKNIQEIIDKVEDGAEIIDNIVGQLVDSYCKNLDDYVAKVKEGLDDTAYPLTDPELEQIVMKLPTHLYFVGEAVESLGIREDIAKSVKMELYNEVHMNTQGTVADKEAAALSETTEEALVNVCYQRAYKKIKLRMEAAYEMLNSIKKVLSRRMLEMQLSLESHGGKNYE